MEGKSRIPTLEVTAVGKDVYSVKADAYSAGIYRAEEAVATVYY